MSSLDTPFNRRFLTSTSRFNQSHPGLKWFALFNIIVIPLIVFAASQIAASHSPIVTPSLLTSSGVRPMTANNLVKTVILENRSVFWLDRISGDSYSNRSIQDGIDEITYLPENAKAPYLNTSDLVIKTYRNSGIYSAQLHPLEATADNTVETLGGIKVSYNPADLDHSVVYFNNRAEIVVIEYPAIQSLSTVVNDAQSLIPIS